MTQVNATFKALADPTRREILRLLAPGDLSAGEIADRFEMTKPSISHHLNVLKQAGLVLDERRGQNIIYSLNTTVFQSVTSWVMTVMQRSRRSGGTRGKSRNAASKGEDDDRR
jgi:ArsR family transcriptional regulator